MNNISLIVNTTHTVVNFLDKCTLGILSRSLDYNINNEKKFSFSNTSTIEDFQKELIKRDFVFFNENNWSHLIDIDNLKVDTEKTKGEFVGENDSYNTKETTRSKVKANIKIQENSVLKIDAIEEKNIFGQILPSNNELIDNRDILNVLRLIHALIPKAERKDQYECTIELINQKNNTSRALMMHQDVLFKYVFILVLEYNYKKGAELQILDNKSKIQVPCAKGNGYFIKQNKTSNIEHGRNGWNFEGDNNFSRKTLRILMK